MSFTILIHILIPFLRSNFFFEVFKTVLLIQFTCHSLHPFKVHNSIFLKKKKKKNTSQGCAAIIAVQSLSHVWLCKPQGLQHTRLPCPSPSPGACPNSSPWNQWCHPTISSFVIPFSSRLQSFPTSGSLPVSQLFASEELTWPKYWSFSFGISPSNEYLGLIPFRIDWFDLLAVRGTLKSFL